MRKAGPWLIVVVVLAVVYAAPSAIGAVVAMRVPRLLLTASAPSDGLRYQDVAFPARDGVGLKGWLVGTGDSAVIVVHGGFQNRVDEVVDTLGLARELTVRGYSVLLFDLRGRGESEGRAKALGQAIEDIGGAVDFLESKGFARDRVAVMGFCSGAAMSATFASQELVGAIVLDGCFLTVKDIVTAEAVALRIPQYVVDLYYPGLRAAAKLEYGALPPDPVDIIPKVECPILFIHEEKDNVVSWEDTLSLSAASSNPSNAQWEAVGALHSEGFRLAPDDYVGKVVEFLSKTLNSKSNQVGCGTTEERVG